MSLVLEGLELSTEAVAVPQAGGTSSYLVASDDAFTVARTAVERGYAILSLLSAYDMGEYLGVQYIFVKPASSAADFDEFRFHVKLPKKDADGNPLAAETPSIVDACSAANWQEREMYDMYGINFVGHPKLTRIFLPEGWKGFPMLKDYKEPEQFVAMREGEDVVLATNEEGSW